MTSELDAASTGPATVDPELARICEFSLVPTSFDLVSWMALHSGNDSA